MGLSQTFKTGLTVLLLGGLVLSVWFFYAEENWRGKRAWQECQTNLTAKGETLDWKKYIPATVSADQNFFAAPKMAEWFVRDRQSTNHDWDEVAYTNTVTTVLAEITVRLPSEGAGTNRPPADVVLRYSSFGNAFFIPAGSAETNESGANAIIPIIQFEDVPISLAIENLARQAEIKYTVDPDVFQAKGSRAGDSAPERSLSVRWEKITAGQALLASLNESGLKMVEDPRTHEVRLTRKTYLTGLVYIADEDRKFLKKLIEADLGTNTLVSPAVGIFSRPASGISPLRIEVIAEKPPSAAELADLVDELFPGDSSKADSLSFMVNRTGFNTFELTLKSVPALDYINWGDHFDPDLNLIRSALKRPLVRMDGDYENPYEMPTPNYSRIRNVVWMLARRAECHLLSGRSDLALDDLLLISGMRRILEGKPNTLVSTMINTAIARLFTEVVTDGITRHAWSESELIALQIQLSQINLVPACIKTFREEEVAECFSLESGWSNNFQSSASGKIVMYFPRGWLYQNLTEISELTEEALDSYDSIQGTFRPKILNDFERKLDNIRVRLTPYTYLAALAVPSFCKAAQTLAYNQTHADETQIACALERYRLAQGEYPETLDALLPRFIDKLPHDIIGGQSLHYRRKIDGSFLLYAVGWNEVDDGAETAFARGGFIDRLNGDWVWDNSMP